ncbi:MAG: thiol peroxidase [Desulfobulbaceae bacterium]|nr:MAG: thiol peroxidase [Desulfobulbaceae bacterium]
MTQITLEGKPLQTVGQLPAIGSQAPDFRLTGTDLADKTKDDYAGQKLVLNIFPSIDTSVCAASVRRFNQEAATMDNSVVLCISADLPFAHQRFCETEGLDRVIPLSVFRSSFGADYQVTIADGPLAGLLSRALIVIDENGKVIYTEQVPEIGQEPDYEKALQALAG